MMKTVKPGRFFTGETGAVMIRGITHDQLKRSKIEVHLLDEAENEYVGTVTEKLYPRHFDSI